MATTANNKIVKEKFNTREFIATALEKFSDSAGDMIITVAVTGFSLYYIIQLLPHQIAGSFVGIYIAGMLVQLFIRIVHRFDDHYTTDELAERVIEFEHTVNQKLDDIKGEL